MVSKLLIGTLSFLFLLGVTLASVTPASAADFFCYMEDQGGNVIDLSNSLCSTQTPAPGATSSNGAAANRAPFTATDNEFYQMYERSINGAASVEFIQSKFSKDDAIASAKKYCQARQSGISSDAFKRTQLAGMQGGAKDPILDRVLTEYIDAIQDFAPRYYCPEFD